MRRCSPASLESPEFCSGAYSTDLVERIRSRAGAEEPAPPDEAWIAAALALAAPSGVRSQGGSSASAGPPDPWDEPTAWRPGA
jgi:hypothetical protein